MLELLLRIVAIIALISCGSLLIFGVAFIVWLATTHLIYGDE